MPKSTSSDPFAALLTSLCALPDTGEKGFEGLLRDAVAKVIRRRLSLMKSGPQGGIDMGTDPLDSGPAIAVEAKRYDRKTPLGLDRLKSKLVDAVHQHPELDLIVFGATRKISLGDQKALIQSGEQMGIGVVIIDWPLSATILPLLAVLCALTPEAVFERLDPVRKASVIDCLDQIRQHPNFTSASAELVERLTQPDLGWTAARRAMADWLREVFADPNAGLAELDGLVNLQDGRVRRISRPKLEATLNHWWDSRLPHIALLGEEGVGKSWAPLIWWLGRAGEDGTGLPLTLVIPARDVDKADAMTLVPHLLAKRTGLRDESFWRRRVSLWLKAPDQELRFLLIIDGLNQHWTFNDWDRLLAQLTAPPWRGRVAVILTCRTDHWNEALRGMGRVNPPLIPHKVEPFDDDGELDAILALHGLTRTDFVDALVPLLRVPRLCELAIRHRTAMAESGDITRERLIYEDWKDRLGRQGIRLKLGDDAFHVFIAGLGRRLREQMDTTTVPDLSLSRRELVDELGADSGHDRNDLYGTVSEIIDGRWMEPVANKPDRFRLNRSLTPYALGMALVDTLRETPESGLKDRLAAFLEPLREQDLAVALLRAAVTVALVDAGSPASLRRLLVDAWFQRQNFQQVDFETFWRLLPQNLDLFFGLAEDTWLHRHVGRQGDEILIKGFVNAAERWPEVGEKIAGWCAAWLGTHWADPRKGAVINYDPKREGVAEREAQTRERRLAWDAFARSLSLAIPIRDGVDGDVPWLACRVLSLVSYGSRLRFLPALAAWAVSRAIMGEGVDFGEVAWILRLPAMNVEPGEAEEAVVAAVRQEAQRLLDLDHPVATKAARLLLAALATPEAASLAETLPREQFPPWSWPTKVTVNDTDGMLRWEFDAARRQSGNNSSPLKAARDLSGYATDPDLHLSSEDAATLGSLADQTDTTRLWLGGGMSSEDSALDGAEAALARWAPEALGALYRRLFAEASSPTGLALERLASPLPAHLLVLGEAERAAIMTAEARLPNDGNDDQYAKLMFQLAALAEKPAAEQIRLFLQQPDGPNFDLKHRRVLAAPTPDDFVIIAEQLRPDSPVPWLRGWLWYLAHAPLDALPPGFPALLSLLTHPSPEVRLPALTVVYESEDPELAVAVADSSWRWSGDMDRREAIAGSLALVGAARRCSSTEIRQRIDPQAWGFLALREKSGEDDLQGFSDFVQQYLRDDMSGPRPSRTGHPEFYIMEHPLDLLVERRGEQVIEWLQPLMSGDRKTRYGIFFEDFPYIDLCRALLRHRPDDGAALWTILRRQHDRDIFKSGTLPLLPFEAPDSEPVAKLRRLACDTAYTDQDLGKIATAVIMYNLQDGLIETINNYLNAASAGRIARGLWLAGLLDTSPAAEDLWRTTLATSPAPGWLADVHELAHRLYQRNHRTHHWLEAFLAERNRDQAFGLYHLFQCCADHRVYGWAPKRVGEVLDDLPEAWRVHWSLCWPNLKATIEKKNGQWKETMFGHKIPSRVQWPWQ